MKLKMPKSQYRKKEMLKNLYSPISSLVQVNEKGEFDKVINEAIKLFNKYGINKLWEVKRGKVVDFQKYKEEKENL